MRINIEIQLGKGGRMWQSERGQAGAAAPG